MTNIVFFGSSKYSVIVAGALHKAFGLSAVVTIPDRPVGRKEIITPSPVKQFAFEKNIPFLTYDRLDTQAIEKIGALAPDFLVVADYGLLLPHQLLKVPKVAPLNVHHSLLPKYRGPSPAPTAILAGEKTTGVTVIKMTDRLDAGDILGQKPYDMTADDTTDSLLTTLNTLGGELVVEVINNYEKLSPKEQDETKVVLTSHMKKEDGFIDLENSPDPDKLDRMIRAYYPWPGVWTKWRMANGQWRIVKFLPGQKLQVEGRNPMTVKDFLNGYPEMKQVLKRILGDAETKQSLRTLF